MAKTIQASFFRVQKADTGLIRSASKRAVGMKWLQPLGELHGVQGVSFGRGITQSVEALVAPVKLSIRNKERAVVMPAKQYEEIVAMMETYPDLVDKAKEADLMNAANSFDALYFSITASTEGADALFSDSADDINASYKPGETESL